MSETLAVKYRPKTFDEVVEQDLVKAILTNQIKTGQIKGAYLFEGPAGCGKTTSARLFAKAINGSESDIIEVNAASNNSVDDVRRIAEGARYQSISSKYKVYILDECHLLSASAWGALLKTLEEPPANTIFILCTTDAQKIPQTIISRVQAFRFTKISLKGIQNRLDEICYEEYGCYPFPKEAVDYIAKQAQGGMRDAISLMGKVLDSLPENSITGDDCVGVDVVVDMLGLVDYTVMAELARALLILPEGDKVADIVQGVYDAGKDLKLFLRNFTSFALDMVIYYQTNDIAKTMLPPTQEWASLMHGLTHYQGDVGPLRKILDATLDLAAEVKWDNQPKTIIVATYTLLRMEVAK